MYKRLDNLKCPKCGELNCVSFNQDNAFFTPDYVDIPANCEKCKEELRIVYDFTECTIDSV